ncbi:DNA translocase FtsK [Halothiobacillus sp.]|uniref:DNA translocase FtsK n=1 Tax=Halothiobacillus sp. TaxID=1891311 RepID=UPI00261B6E3A|nr:DNA translocase FtsK [Halothiobacillus sp.]MDD4967180.1 DNA translocase FtsK 4TM domain-containing protein [Halothiobacillus sp.]
MNTAKNTVLFQPRRMMADMVLLGLVLLVGYYGLSLWTYSPSDPGFTTTGQGSTVHNAAGLVGAWLADFSRFLLGYGAYAVPPMLLVFAVRQFVRLRTDDRLINVFFAIQISGVVLTVFAISVLAAIHQPTVETAGGLAASGSSGGVVGQVLAAGLVRYLGVLGATGLMLGFVMIAFSAVSGLSWLALFELVGRWVDSGIQSLLGLVHRVGKTSDQQTESSPIPTVQTDYVAPFARKRKKKQEEATPVDPVLDVFSPAPVVPEAKPIPARAAKAAAKQQPVLGTSGGKPIVDLLDFAPQRQSGFSEEMLESMSRLIEDRLEEFGVRVAVVAATPGPVITRFELQPAAGVKVSQISNLAKDLARALSIVSVRVVEVIPGKSTVGLEIPNKVREIIALRELIESKSYRDSRSPLTMALGKDIAGASVTADLARMPHLLVAGTTGSGKSVGVNAMILSLLYKSTADDVRLILIDPKMLELSVYEGIPHLLAPVVTDMKEAANALRWAVGEMERRYKLMSALGVRNLAGCNEKISAAAEKGEPLRDPFHNPAEAFDPDLPAPELERLPHIVVVVDEFADMMMVVGKKVEELIARLAQKARAAGIHLILATQRPSVDVITGLIKANIPTRISFQVSSKIDSRTILDQMGAENLLGHGDMLYLPPGTGLPMRVHGAFVSDDEVHRVVEALKALGEPNYIDAVLSEESAAAIVLPGEKPVSASGEAVDEYYDQAVAIVTETRKASISYVQRRLKIGYNRAARLIEEMENDGIVGQLQANGSREVLAPPPPRA